MKGRIYLEANEYQKLAGRTLNPALTREETILNAALGCAGEAGEVADIVKKHRFHGHDLDTQKIVMELGDQLWYIAQMASALNIPLSLVMEMNIEKLEFRYLNKGGFSSENSINRED